jgi:TolB-like protein
MSPEQLRADPLDERSDLYSVGAVLYEMACGRRAFDQESSAALIGAILGQEPVAPREISPGVSVNMERIILRCLQKNPSDRYASAGELAADLREITAPTGRRIRRVRRSRVTPVAATAVAAPIAIALLLVAFNIGGLRDRLFSTGATTVRSLVVLPLANLSGDPEQEYFADGMTEELINRLAQIGGLRVISRSSAMQYKRAKKSVGDIARELDVNMVVEGSVSRAGESVKISAQLIDALKDRHLWAQSYERTLSNVLALQSEVAKAIVENVRVRLTPEERKRLGSVASVDPEAHKACLKGRYEFSQLSGESYRRAVEFFNQAIQIDPNYAPAYAGLADAYSLLSGNYLPTDEAMPRALAAATKALELDPGLASAHAALGYILMFHKWDWEGAEREYRLALENNPGEASALQNYGA